MHNRLIPVTFQTVIVLSLTGAALGVTIFVKADATGANDGTSWENAYTFLTAGLLTAPAGDEVWVAAGTYKPVGDRAGTFELPSGVGLYGGFDGTETQRNQRDPDGNVTVLSGDLNGDDGPDFTNYNDNSYHVVYIPSGDNNTILDGFTVRSGNADGPFEPNRFDRGGGVYVRDASPIIRDCIFTLNVSDETGLGSAICIENASPAISYCDIMDNAFTAMRSFGADQFLSDCRFLSNRGTALHHSSGDLVLVNSIVAGSGLDSLRSQSVGGVALYNERNINVISDCFFSSNYGKTVGGLLATGTTVLTNCLFNDNLGGTVGAIESANADVILANCTISKNTGGTTGGVFNQELFVTLMSTIVWANAAESANNTEQAQILYYQANPKDPPVGTFIIDHSTVEGWSGVWGGEGNNGFDPLFVDPDGPDNIPGTEDDDLRLSPGSPAIDSGDNTAVPADEFDLDGDGDTVEPIPFDLDGLPRFIDDPATKDTGVPSKDDPARPIVDRGAYEFQVTPPPCEGDANGDGAVDPLDSGYVLARFGCPVNTGDPTCDAADVNGDLVVDPLDVGYVLSRFGACP